MNCQRKHDTGPEKGALRRLHLREKKPVSGLGDPYGIHPTLCYRWQQECFENGAAAFANHGKRRKAAEDAKGRKSAALEGKRQQQNEVVAELMPEYVQLKK